ncbi:unnamed protein product [Schistosoma mattheei]|uniref:Uncharacterized protein n=1 Tax=Schistosoma mattheei TaxID=31246 RepID=A0A183PYV2_9TREM|nr:unnamed protein product [Schistosoma mattheei]
MHKNLLHLLDHSTVLNMDELRHLQLLYVVMEQSIVTCPINPALIH